MPRKNKKSISLAKLNTLRLDQDGPTPERLAKLPGVTIMQNRDGARVAAFGQGERKPVGADGIVRITDAPLDRLAARQRLDEGDAYRNGKLHEAGDRLRQHWYRAGLDGSLGSADLNRAGGGGNGHPAWLTPNQESTAYHRERFRRARDGMEAGHWEVAFGICCDEDTLEGAGRTAGFGNAHAANAVALDRLRRGLEFLAIVWGILPPKPVNDNAAELAGDRPVGRAVTTVVRGDDVDAIVERLMLANAEVELQRAG